MNNTISIIFYFYGRLEKINLPGMLFFIYLILNGIERFFIEKLELIQNMTFLEE